VRVELLYTDADPVAMAARQRLVEVLLEDAYETPVQMVVVNSIEDAEFLGFPGSPTIRIDGEDIDPAGAGSVALGPRSYGDAPLPSVDLIRAAIDRARGWSHGRR
jgi:hypothetical protein